MPSRILNINPYSNYGLSQNPFLVHALGADDRGVRLMVGRDQEISLVAQRLHKHGKITCLDGHVGVGKTSLVNVAAYECFKAYFNGETEQLLIPMGESFQLKKDEDVKEFCIHVFRKVAQTLLSHREKLSAEEITSPVFQQISSWLNSPLVSHINGSMGMGGTIGVPGVAALSMKADSNSATQLNTTSAFSEHGFEQLVRDWLGEIFTGPSSGGVVCVIDNLELLESGASARRTLEALRDRLFTVHGLRWVFCGANGVIHSLAASPRLSSFLSTPVIDVANVQPKSISPLIKARFEEFSEDPGEIEQRLPIRMEDLERLYLAVNFNLRDLLGLADDYCEHQGSLGKSPLNEIQKAKRFEKWLDSESGVKYQSLQSRLPSDSWAILDFAMSDECHGTFGVGDYDTFNSNSKRAVSQSKFDKSLKDLVKLGLLSKTVDDDVNSDDGFKRDVFTVTAKGALVHYARLQRSETQTVAPVTWLKRVHAK